MQMQGTCEPRFAAVRDAFEHNFTTLGETGASLSVTVDGRPVIDLWAGFADAAKQRPWQRDTIANVYSTTKGMTAICLHRLLDAGRIDLDAPVARYWPEFAQADKAALPVRHLLTHQAGLPAIAQPLPPDALYDWPVMTAALAAQAPWWTPGTRHGYHALTFGHLVGEVVRRVSGQSVGSFFKREVARPLDLDCHIGFGPELDARVAELIPPPPPSAEQVNLFSEVLRDPDALLFKVFLNPFLPPDAVGTRAWRAAEIPAANGHTNARALARLYGVLACGGTLDGVRVLTPPAIDRARTEQCAGTDAVLPMETRFALGFMLSTAKDPMGPNPRTFGHGGMGGSMGFADPDARVGFGYVMNEMHAGLWLVDPRVTVLTEALYGCL